MVVYDVDSNAILVECLQSRQAKDIKNAWLAAHTRLNTNGNAPTTYILDNEISNDLRTAFKNTRLSTN